MGTLYVVSTPIGNLKDISFRAIRILFEVDYIVAEDIEKIKRLREYYVGQIEIAIVKKPEYIHIDDFSESTLIPKLIPLFESGKFIALVSEAGTPLISDPGYKLVIEAKKRGIGVIPVPGPTAAITALSVSGLPTDKFYFLGFLPKSEKHKGDILTNLKSLLALTSDMRLLPTVVFYESPHRIVETLKIFLDVFGDIQIVIARELTKIHEEVINKKVSEFIHEYTTGEPRGEFTILFHL